MKSFLATTAIAMVGLMGGVEIASADMIARYECTNVGMPTQEAIGDQTGHNFAVFQHVCVGVDGTLKGAVYNGFANTEWNGPKGTWVSNGAVHRVPGGIAVSQGIEGTGSVIIQDGKPVGAQASGTGSFKFASGVLSSLAGKTFKWTSKTVGYNRIVVEFTD